MTATVLRQRRIVVALLVALFAAPFTAGAQDPTPVVTTPSTPCDYDSCVLRVEETWFSRKLVRGPDGAEVARLGWGGPSLASIVATSDSAVVHARRYQRAQNTASVLGLVIAVASVVSIVAYSQDDLTSDRQTQLAAVSLGTVVASFVGQAYQTRARRELSRSLWWYNRTVLGGG